MDGAAAGRESEGSWIRVLASLGYAQALPAISASLQADNPWLVRTTIENLGRWPDPAPIDRLLELAETSPNPDYRERALAAALQLATAAVARRAVRDEEAAAWFQRSNRAVRSAEDKRLMVAALGRWKHIESFRLLLPYLEDPEVKALAPSAIVSAVEPESRGLDSVAARHYSTVEPFLEKIAAMGDQSVADRIALLKRGIEARRNPR